MIDWDELPSEVLDEMAFLGNFKPTAHSQNREVKGYMHADDSEDGRVYLDSNDLRRLAAACIHVADWLDVRAAHDAEKRDTQ